LEGEQKCRIYFSGVVSLWLFGSGGKKAWSKRSSNFEHFLCGSALWLKRFSLKHSSVAYFKFFNGAIGFETASTVPHQQSISTHLLDSSRSLHLFGRPTFIPFPPSSRLFLYLKSSNYHQR
jgi:hypothetical protein